VGGSAVVDEGEYPGDLKAIEDGPSLQYGPTWRFIFNVYVEGEAEELDALVSVPRGNVTPKSKLLKFAKALLGRELETDETFELDDLVGKGCRVVVDINDSGYSTITAIKPAAKRTAKAAAAAAE
jgi:hypothetical protein